MSIFEIISDAAEQSKRESRPLPEAQVATLLEEFAHYSQPCQFKPGDLITPRATSSYSDRGVPHIVLEVRDEPIRNFAPGDDISDVFSSAFGARLDIRVAIMVPDGRVVTFWQESWRHEPYTGPRPHVAG